MVRPRNLTLVLLVAVLLAACGDDESSSEGDGGAAKTQATRVLSDADIDAKNLLLDEPKAAVRARFGPPYKSFLKRFRKSKKARGVRIPCDMYRKHEPDVGPESRYALLCYRHGKLAVVTVPYTP